MPGVKLIHQNSSNNSKPKYIMGHSCQSLSILAGVSKSIFAIPLATFIHEGTKLSNRDQKTLIDKSLSMLDILPSKAFYLVVDAYYATQNILKGVKSIGGHVIVRVKKTAIAYKPPCNEEGRKRRDRPKEYGEKVLLKDYFSDETAFQGINSPVYGEKTEKVLVRTLKVLERFYLY